MHPIWGVEDRSDSTNTAIPTSVLCDFSGDPVASIRDLKRQSSHKFKRAARGKIAFEDFQDADSQTVDSPL
jgi:hypothetical protein